MLIKWGLNIFYFREIRIAMEFLLHLSRSASSLTSFSSARRSNQSILKEVSPEYSLEGLMLKLNLQYFGYLMQGTDSLEKSPDSGKD